MTHTTYELSAAQWQEYFNSVTKQLGDELITVEALSADFGDQLEVKRLPVQGFSYDAREQILAISVGGRTAAYPVVLTHSIANPQAISVDESAPHTPRTIQVTDGGGVTTLIRFFSPQD
jgi:hypothetical protein